MHLSSSDISANDSANFSAFINNFFTIESGLFDVTMGAYDGAEICEVIGSFLVVFLKIDFQQNFEMITVKYKN